MRTIWKYPLKITDRQTLELPRRAEILAAQFQLSTLQIWALIDPDQSLEERVIEIYGTGHSVPDGFLKHISTVQEEGGFLVWHIFERPQ